MNVRNENEHQIQKFLELRSNLAAKTVEFYRCGLHKYLTYAGNSWPPTPELLAGFVGWCKSPPDGSQISDGSVAAYYRAVRTWVNWLHKTRRIASNPAKEIAEPKQPRTRIPKAPPVASTNALFDDLEEEIAFALKRKNPAKHWLEIRDFVIFSFMLGTGARVGEVSALLVSDVDLAACTAIFRRTKDKAPRVVSFSRRVASDLKLWLEVRSKFDIDPAVKSLFVTHYRGRWQKLLHWGIRDTLHRHCNRIGITDFSPHALRHAFAIRSLQNGGSLADIRDQLGHSDIATTNVYLIAADEEQAERIRKASPR
jgi:site-specific recombinase XerD